MCVLSVLYHLFCVSSLSKLAQSQVPGMGPYASVCSQPSDLSSEHLLHQRETEVREDDRRRGRDKCTDTEKVVSS